RCEQSVGVRDQRKHQCDLREWFGFDEHYFGENEELFAFGLAAMGLIESEKLQYREQSQCGSLRRREYLGGELRRQQCEKAARDRRYAPGHFCSRHPSTRHRVRRHEYVDCEQDQRQRDKDARQRRLGSRDFWCWE